MTKAARQAKKQAKTSEVIVADVDLELAKLTTTSGRIRYLNSLGWKRGQIASKLTYPDGRKLRYQHVRNVLVQPLKKQA